MKRRIPDQAEKLRQIAAQEKSDRVETDSSVAVLPKEEVSITDTDLEVIDDLKISESPEIRDLPSSEEKIPSQTKQEDKKKSVSVTNKAPVQPVPTDSTNAPPVLSGEIKKIAASPESTSTILDYSSFRTKRLPVEKKTRVIAVTGGKGGVGKSNVACALGIAFTHMKRKVILLDADLSLANVDVILGLTPRLNLSHVIRGEKTLEEIMIHGPEGMILIPGGSGLEELSHLTPEQMDRLFHAFTSIQPSPDVFLIDTAAGIHSNVMHFLMAADQVIVVTTPEPPAYTDAYALIKILVKHDPKKDLGVLINMAQDAGEANEIAKLMLQMSRQFLNVGFNNLGFVPRDSIVREAVRHQESFLTYAPSSYASKAIRNIAASVMQVSGKDGNSGGIRRFLKRLFGSSTPPKTAASS